MKFFLNHGTQSCIAVPWPTTATKTNGWICDKKESKFVARRKSWEEMTSLLRPKEDCSRDGDVGFQISIDRRKSQSNGFAIDAFLCSPRGLEIPQRADLWKLRNVQTRKNASHKDKTYLKHCLGTRIDKGLGSLLYFLNKAHFELFLLYYRQVCCKTIDIVCFGMCRRKEIRKVLKCCSCKRIENFQKQ